ncbi:MAG: hypothetical protein U0W40_10505 [Acidimicrobiia bacterium]
MCRAATCKRCGKPTWKGCGMHVEQVLGDVPKSQRCRCAEGVTATAAGAGASAPRSRRGWFRR